MGISVFFLTLFLFCFTQAGRSVLNRDNLLNAHWNHNTSLHFATFLQYWFLRSVVAWPLWKYLSFVTGHLSVKQVLSLSQV